MDNEEYKSKVNDAECSTLHLINIIRPFHTSIFIKQNQVSNAYQPESSIWMRVVKTICEFYKSAIPETSLYKYAYYIHTHTKNNSYIIEARHQLSTNIADYYFSRMDPSDVRDFMLWIYKQVPFAYTQTIPLYIATHEFPLNDVLCTIDKSKLKYKSITQDDRISYRYSISLNDIRHYLESNSDCLYNRCNEGDQDYAIKLPIMRNKWLLELFPDEKEYTKFIAVLRCLLMFDDDNKYRLRAMNICTIEAYKLILIRVLQVLLADIIMVNKNANVVYKQRNNNIRGLKHSKHCVIIHDLKQDDEVKRIPGIRHEGKYDCMYGTYIKHILIGFNEVHYKHCVNRSYSNTKQKFSMVMRYELIPNIKTDNSMYSIKNPMQTPTDVQIREMATIIMLDMMTIDKKVMCKIVDKYIEKLRTLC